jgi:hypothetical protein
MGGTYGTMGVKVAWSWWGNPKKRDQLEELSLDGRIILKWIFQNV